MNFRLLSKYLGYLSVAIGALMVPSTLFSIWYWEWRALAALLLSALTAAAAGAGLIYLGRRAPDRLRHREGLGIVGLSWVLVAGLGALPFVYGGVLGPVDAYFESMSGFTTTGASVFATEDFETVPKSIMFWRSFTHWLGGMGIIVLFIAVLPYLGAGGKHLFRSESPGPDPRGLRPRIKDTAKILYTIYLGMTVAQTAALMFAGMNLYEALCHTFGTLATGGFSTRAASVGEFQSSAIDVIIIFFMICAGANFALYHAMLAGDWRAPLKDTEWRVYIGILAASTLLVTINLMGVEGSFPADGTVVHAVAKTQYRSFWEALRYGAFQVVSVMTTTGFCTDDFDRWPFFSRALLVVLMFVGGCAGSTGGGVKVVRLIVLLKIAVARLESTFRPKDVRAIRISGEVVPESIQGLVQSFFVLYVLWFALGCLVMSALGLPFQTAVTSVAATLNNIGPGLEAVGATMNYAAVPGLGKVFLSLCMVLGRLELFSILVLFVPSFWRSH